MVLEFRLSCVRVKGLARSGQNVSYKKSKNSLDLVLSTAEAVPDKWIRLSLNINQLENKYTSPPYEAQDSLHFSTVIKEDQLWIKIL